MCHNISIIYIVPLRYVEMATYVGKGLMKSMPTGSNTCGITHLIFDDVLDNDACRII